MNAAGIVLCGGKSSRMGWPKGSLPFGDELMLQRVVRLLQEVVEPVVVVAAAGQELPLLPGGVIVARDQRPARGPLEGLRAGLSAIGDRAVAAYVTGCDFPLLQPSFVRQVLAELSTCDVAVPVEGELHHPLAAAYRTCVLGEIERLLERDRLRTTFLLQQVTTRRIPVDQLRGSDPELLTLRNVNDPGEYVETLRVARIEPDPQVLARLGAAG